MPDTSLEEELLKEPRVRMIAGLDEAGRGAIAGPVVAAAVVLPLTEPAVLDALKGVDDSKRLSPARREELFKIIARCAVAYAIGASSAAQIDADGIISANALAMQSAVGQLQARPDFLLLDGRMRLKNCPLPQRSVIRGDAISLSIAAASILAKVSRDRWMVALDRRHPQYGFSQHKGYCTSQHVAALAQYGPCEEHRRTFAPLVRTLL